MTGRTLLTGPYAGRMLGALGERCTPGMTIVVPNVQAGIAVTRYLRKHARTVTLTQLARDVLRRSGWRAMRSGERDRLLREVLEDVALEWLEGIRDRPSTHAVLLGLIGELQRAHVDPAALSSVVASPRDADIARVYAAYHAACAAQRVYDASGTEHHAARLPDLAPHVVAVTGFWYLDASQLALVGRLAAPGSLMTLPGGAGLPRRSQETADALGTQGWMTFTLPGGPVTAGDHVTAGVLDGHVVPELIAGEAADLDGEVRLALQEVRRWLRAGVPPEEIAVIVRLEGRYIDALADIGAEYSLPLLSGAQRPLREAGLGRLLRAWIRAQESGWAYADTRALLTDPLLEWPWTLERAAALQGSRPAGLDAWNPDLRWLALPAVTTRAAGFRAVQRLLREGGVGARCRRDPELNRWVTAALRHLRPWSADDAAGAREAVLAELGFALGAVTQPALNTRSGVRVLNPLGALGRSFRRVVILGLADGTFPIRRRDHALVDTVTRRRWAAGGVALPDVLSLADVEEPLLLGCVATAREQLVITRPRRDDAGDPLAPSPFWARFQPGQTLAAPPPGSALEQEIRRALRGHASADVARRAAYERDRVAGHLTAHSGLLPNGVAVTERAWSLSELHVASLCRMRWFLEHGLGVRDPGRAWTQLAQVALDGALGVGEDGPDAQFAAAGHAVDVRAAELRRSGWHPGRLWPVRRSELLAGTRRVLRHPNWQPPGMTVRRGTHTRRVTVQAGAHAVTLNVRIDRLDDVAGEARVTLYRPGDAPRAVDTAAALTGAHRLALTLEAAGAAAGRYVSLASGRAVDPLPDENQAVAPLAAQARGVLAGVLDTLAAGDVRPRTPEPRVCGACPGRAVCRVAA
ncbi:MULTISPECIES: PD-(D/E)XK nuclease family protein [Deinococcus]|uniref:PD-(D/E)XK nuclease family protein n=1 Tax=Deinococcus rufus TaxID=2136097 RepID=A0ABV7Z8J4_9DEIO|nr:PD-(D/E)XK nuclease family protein [Deinococcus sp. AB2017081]WQE97140.1 PD-(D/E)XK nuclease family protein [Deinococcus sp. AB2017081]